jgi:hypothetical protein
MRGLAWLNVASILTCVAVTFLNQYVTHCNAQIWLTGHEWNAYFASVNISKEEMLDAHEGLLDELDMVSSLADSERIRAEKLDYKLDRANDQILQLKAYVAHLLGICKKHNIDPFQPPEKSTK